MKIHLIWAQDYNSGIGKKGNIPWHITEDLKQFKQLTTDSIIIMGRKTWDSLPYKPLKNRRNIVLSSNFISNAEFYKSKKECLEKMLKEQNEKIFIIGGAEIYKLFFNKSDVLHITFVDKKVEGIDTYFPISIKKIKTSFIKKEEYELTDKVIYTKWIKFK